MITHQSEKYGWEFIFMGANIDVAKEGGKLGIPAVRSFRFNSTSRGICSMYSEVASLCGNIRRIKPRGKNSKT
jgi:hypothetical protein